MEIEGSEGFFSGLDNASRSEALPHIETAETLDDALEFAAAYFDENVSSFSAAEVLDMLDISKLHPTVAEHEAFDPKLFQLVVLLEIPHAEGLDAFEILDRLQKFWQTADSQTPEEFDTSFNAHLSFPGHSPFAAMDRFLVLMLSDIHARKIINSQPKEARDPIEELVDGNRPKLIDFPKPEGDREVLTDQLLRDLSKQHIQVVIEELELRFHDSKMGAGDIIPLLERIVEERKQGVLPMTEELVEGYLNSRTSRMFGRFGAERTPEQVRRSAMDQLLYLRSEEARTRSYATYIPELRQWVTRTYVDLEDGTKNVLKDAYVGVAQKRLRELTDQEKKKLGLEF